MDDYSVGMVVGAAIMLCVMLAVGLRPATNRASRGSKKKKAKIQWPTRKDVDRMRRKGRRVKNVSQIGAA